MFSLKNVEKPLVLQCFHSKMLKKHWFYYVFAQKCWKTIGFTVFSLKNVEKPLVLQAKEAVKPIPVVKPVSIYGFGPWVSHTRLDELWGTLTAKLFRD